MSTDPWQTATETLVAEGLIEPEQREGVADWLTQNAPRPSAGPFLDIALVAVITVGNWLLVGALAMAVSLLVSNDDAPSMAMLVAGAGLFAIGLGARMVGSRALAQGFFSAWVPVVALGSTQLFEVSRGDVALGLLALLLVPALIGYGIAVYDDMAGLAAASGLAAFIPLATDLYEVYRPISELTAPLAMLLTMGVVVFARWWPERALTFTAALPFSTVLVMMSLLMRESWMGTGLTALMWEAGAVSALYGFGLVGAAAVARSRLVLICGVGALVFSEYCLLFAIGDFWIGIAVLTIEGVLLIGVAVAALLARTRAQAVVARA